MRRARIDPSCLTAAWLLDAIWPQIVWLGILSAKLIADINSQSRKGDGQHQNPLKKERVKISIGVVHATACICREVMVNVIVKDLVDKFGLNVIAGEKGLDRTVQGGYCGDFGRA